MPEEVTSWWASLPPNSSALSAPGAYCVKASWAVRAIPSQAGPQGLATRRFCPSTGINKLAK